jgi:type IV secretion system protein VirD4
MYATCGKKVRYYAEKKLAARTKIAAPEMPPIRINPAIAANSLRVIAAAQDVDQNAVPGSAGPTFANAAARPAGPAASGSSRLNEAAINAAKVAPDSERVATLFKHIVKVSEARAA